MKESMHREMKEIILRDIEGDDDMEEVEAETQMWKYVFGFTEMAVIKCAIELGIADILERNGGSMLLVDLSSTLKCPPPILYRIMRFLSHRKIFKQQLIGNPPGEWGDPTVTSYSQTRLSRRLLLGSSSSSIGGGKIDNDHNCTSMAPFILLESSSVMLAPWLNLTRRVLDTSNHYSAFDSAHGGQDVWSYAAGHPAHSNLINDAMACDARLVVPQIIKACPQLFHGVSTIVDVGGGDGTALSILVQAFPGLRGINFDLPHVSAAASSNPHLISHRDRIHHVGGNMFTSIPTADAAFIMWVLHDWGDDKCVEILKKCKEAIGRSNEKGKVIIVEAVVGEVSSRTENDMQLQLQLQDVRLMLDMVMMAHTTHGKERTLSEWDHLLHQAGFTHFNVYHIHSVQSIIVAFP